MFVGATGSGKSTLVDGIINYIMGVSFEDPFRFTVVTLESDERKNNNQVLTNTVFIQLKKRYYNYVLYYSTFVPPSNMYMYELKYSSINKIHEELFVVVKRFVSRNSYKINTFYDFSKIEL